MSEPIRVFICYKKLLSTEREGRIIEQKNSEAATLQEILSQDEATYDPWMDDTELAAGVAWETEIYRRILVTDVLLVLIGPGTSKSQWVQREIALANALGISIVPLAFDLSEDGMTDEMKALDIHQLQGKITRNIKFKTKAALLNEIGGDLEQARQRTKEQQEKTLRDLLSRRNPATPKAADRQRAASFKLEAAGHTINLHVASGDLSRVRGIDVLVNSENDYMQMARVFESRTVSSMLRSRGARIRNGMYEDAIQYELDWQMRERARPLQAGEVCATSAGGPTSDLATENRARYIFHVASVQAVAASNTVIPFKQPSQIERCVRNCLVKLAEVNGLQGIISPPDTEQRKDQERLAAEGRGLSHSIIFPLFGTGQGGSAPADVLEPMLSGLTGYLDDNEGIAAVLSDVYISAFKEQDVNVVIELLRSRFGE
jgi:O-acetyl-ADP-ribose deacetylase (regulator of RNase III)